MKNISFKLISSLIRFFSIIYSYRIHSFVKLHLKKIHTMWIRSQFLELGPRAFIAPPISITGGKYISIGNYFHCDTGARIDAIEFFLDHKFSPSISIGDNVSIQKDCHIAAIGKISIGDGVLVASKVFISDHSHGNSSAYDIRPALRPLTSKGSICIESNVWIGECVSILAGVTIGKNSIIGAGSVVVKSIPSNSIAVGNPARVIRAIGN
jgi:acetyltransferase-like isoleucine patch superfamily enzyme